ncbi:efflux transporter outer membrane subunit [Luteimonas suaedae]|uniref:efflux transporter outer membrane subunit n=1 Tax=Luteimonas suaedae TaxID=2605430 RepID=UPI0011F08A26|nr:efflux transporter outer membrane subunit [Luteimonas suaedae]
MIRPVLSRLALALACAAALAGCASLAPRYETPALPVPANLGGAATAAEAPALAGLAWDDVFLDPRLQQVIALALEENRDLRIAVLNIEQARAQYRIRRADVLPSVGVTASETRARSSAPTSFVGSSEVGRSASVEVGFSAWELDLFGRIRSLSDQALATYLSTEQAQRDTRLSVVAEVAAAWLAVSADQQRLQLARRTLESQQETLRLTGHLHAQGVASGLELAQVQTSVERARVDVAAFTSQLAQSRNALALVVGAPVDAALLPDDTALDAGVALAVLPPNVDSRVLLQRPDVRAAEFTLQAANANIGAARAAFFPSISLTASTGRGSDQLSNLFDGGNRTWSFVPTVTLPIFQAGALRAELDVATIQKDIDIAGYERAIQTAFAEVADTLSAREQLDERLEAQRALVDASQRAYVLSDARHRSGVDSYLDALDAQRTLYAARQELIGLRLTEANNRVTLYKVFGGGADAHAGM